MELSIGSQIGPYQVVGLLGKGGMGEVYRAHDSRLKRDVAVKILPAAISMDPDRVARFQREAQVLASLNHPNIAAIHDVQEINGSSFLILELVEGENLADRIARGPLAIEDALQISRQIAVALETAHEKGIVHRDLKPANVKITPAGTVKVLDFGLAKVFQPETEVSSFSRSPTLVSGTLGGVILGTAPYMSPEQARGQTAGEQADIWAFGVVLYEMLTGKQAFTGETLTDVLGGIVRTDPDWTVLPPATPPLVRILLKQCLQKNRADRLHHIGDARIQIDASTAMVENAAPPVAASKRPTLWIALAILLPLVVAASAAPFVIRYYRLQSMDVGSVQFSVSPPLKAEFGQGGTAPYISLSPDGRKLAFIASTGGVFSIWIRSLDSAEPQRLTGTEGVSIASSPAPFWSPDSRFLAYFAQGKLKKIDVTGGPAQTICDTEGASGTWNRDNVIIFDPGGTSGVLKRVNAAGGQPEPVTVLDASRQEQRHLYPRFLPDGDHFLFLARTPISGNAAIMAASLSSKSVKLILQVDSRPAYDRSGNLLFVREQSLMAQPFDPEKLQTTGEPTPIAESVRYNGATGAASFTVSENGVLAYRSGNEVVGNNFRLSWLDRAGKTISPLGSGSYTNPELSPDGKRLAVERLDPATRTFDIWIIDTVRAVPTRLTFNPGDDRFPVWSPDGAQIAFSSVQKQVPGLYIKSSNGTGNEEALLQSQVTTVFDWSQDGKDLVYAGPPREISVLPLIGSRMPVKYLPQSVFFRSFAQLSPDGRFLAYLSTESGKAEVYVQSFPTPASKWQISVNGGGSPRWRGDGRELFYISDDRKLMAVPVRQTTSGLEILTATALFDVPGGAIAPDFRTSTGRQQYDVTSDGQRFLFDIVVDESADTPVTVITNWAAKLKK